MNYITRYSTITNGNKIQSNVSNSQWDSAFVLFSDLNFDLHKPIEISYDAYFTGFYPSAPNHFFLH